MHSCPTKELRRNQTTLGLKPILCDVRNSQKPQSSSDLVRSDKGRRKSSIPGCTRAHLVHGEQTPARDFQGSGLI